MRRAIFLLVAAMLLAGCAEWESITPDAAQLTQIAVNYPEGPTKDALQKTAIARYVAGEDARLRAENAQLAEQLAASERHEAEAERERQIIAMTAEAQAVVDARESAALATRQAINSQGTAQAISIDGTRQAQNLAAEATAQAMGVAATGTREAGNATATVQASSATATAQSANATATATREAATATIQARLDNARSTAVEATAAGIARLEERERITQPLRTFAPWLVGLLGVVILIILGFHGWRLFEDRARLVRRNPDEGEPIMLITRERMALPMRQFGSYQDMTQGHEHAPLLAPSAEYQSGTTMRQQTANAIQARQVGAVARAKSKAPVIVNGQSRRPPSRPRSRNRVSVPGLVKVVAVGDLAEATAQGILPPRLAKEIEGQWTEVREEIEQ